MKTSSPRCKCGQSGCLLCMAVFSLKPHMVFPPCVLLVGVSFCIRNCSYKDICQNGLGSTPMTIRKTVVSWVRVHSNDNLNLLFKSSISKHSYVVWGWGLGPQQSFREICNLAHDKGSPVWPYCKVNTWLHGWGCLGPGKSRKCNHSSSPTVTMWKGEKGLYIQTTVASLTIFSYFKRGQK